MKAGTRAEPMEGLLLLVLSPRVLILLYIQPRNTCPWMELPQLTDAFQINQGKKDSTSLPPHQSDGSIFAS